METGNNYDPENRAITQLSVRLTILFIYMSIIIGVLILVFSANLSQIFWETDKHTEKITFIGIIFLLVALALLINAYLKGTLSIYLLPPIPELRPTMEHETATEDNDLEDVTFELEQIVDLKQATTTADKIKELETVYGDAFDYYKFKELLGEHMEEVSINLSSEITKTRRNTNVNLVMGIATTLGAVVILVYTLFDTTNVQSSNYDLVKYYIPRITLSVFIEVFSFFFLRLYRRNLEDIKYITNELTNIGMRTLSLKAAFYKNEKDILKDVINDLSKTERNFVLKKGETTRDLQMLQIEKNEQIQTLDKLAQIFNSRKG